MIPGLRSPNGFEQITTITTSTGITAPEGTVLAIINVEAQAVRWRGDGTAPTATIGMNRAVGDTFEYNGDFSKLNFIETVVGAILNISYYK
ncbi:hypothetical protein KAR91_52730 [Candidatus Pacearchaeota archaeon]|nr:hypothetical protein [Candidatus Pacearchaeota archaeon]